MPSHFLFFPLYHGSERKAIFGRTIFLFGRMKKSLRAGPDRFPARMPRRPFTGPPRESFFRKSARAEWARAQEVLTAAQTAVTAAGRATVPTPFSCSATAAARTAAIAAARTAATAVARTAATAAARTAATGVAFTRAVACTEAAARAVSTSARTAAEAVAIRNKDGSFPYNGQDRVAFKNVARTVLHAGDIGDRLHDQSTVTSNSTVTLAPAARFPSAKPTEGS